MEKVASEESFKLFQPTFSAPLLSLPSTSLVNCMQYCVYIKRLREGESFEFSSAPQQTTTRTSADEKLAIVELESFSNFRSFVYFYFMTDRKFSLNFFFLLYSTNSIKNSIYFYIIRCRVSRILKLLISSSDVRQFCRTHFSIMQNFCNNVVIIRIYL